MPAPWLDRLNRDGAFDAILVEADGAASRLLKIPADGEPVIPESCQTTVWIVAIKILGRPLTDEWVHRSARARELLGLPPEARVSEAVLLQLLQHKDGCLKGIPTASRKLALINQADSAAEMAAAQVLGGKLQRLNFARVVITSYANTEPIIRGIAD
jgi:probable selenium-dependent hydroxylase accessory protein YqeC